MNAASSSAYADYPIYMYPHLVIYPRWIYVLSYSGRFGHGSGDDSHEVKFDKMHDWAVKIDLKAVEHTSLTIGTVSGLNGGPNPLNSQYGRLEYQLFKFEARTVAYE